MKTKTQALLSSALLCISMTAVAEQAHSPLGADSAGVRLDNPEVLKLLENGDIQRGEELALSRQAKCTRCHGDLGISDEEDTPSIAGQEAPYLYKQLMDYKTEARENRSMRSRVRKLSEQDLVDISVYYASLPGLGSAGPNTLEAPSLVTQGDKDRLLLSCAVCHGERGEGMPYEVPVLAGQKRQHFIDTMAEYKEGTRKNDLYGRMRYVASRLTDEEIVELAEYYAALGGS